LYAKPIVAEVTAGQKPDVKNSFLLKFADPLAYEGSDEFLLKLIRSTRTQIMNEFEDFYTNIYPQNKTNENTYIMYW
jgi:hypothetical protein